jgi:hypothetical protein
VSFFLAPDSQVDSGYELCHAARKARVNVL